MEWLIDLISDTKCHFQFLNEVTWDHSYKNNFLHLILKVSSELLSQFKGILPFSTVNLDVSMLTPTFFLFHLIIMKFVWRDVKIWFQFVQEFNVSYSIEN